MHTPTTRPHLRTDEMIRLAVAIRQAWGCNARPPELEPLIYAIDAANQQELADFAMAMYRLGMDHTATAWAEMT